MNIPSFKVLGSSSNIRHCEGSLMAYVLRSACSKKDLTGSQDMKDSSDRIKDSNAFAMLCHSD